jgi:hypothetical protein
VGRTYRTAINHGGTALQHSPYRADINFHSITLAEEEEEEVNINQSSYRAFQRQGSSADCRRGGGKSIRKFCSSNNSYISERNHKPFSKEWEENQTIPVPTSLLFTYFETIIFLS